MILEFPQAEPDTFSRPSPGLHLKMMRFLFLCLLLLLPAATAVSEEFEGSAVDDGDDEDFPTAVTERYDPRGRQGPGSPNKATGTDESSNQVTMIIIIVAVTTLTLTVAAIVSIILVRRNMRNRERGIYYVPTEQEQKGV